MDITGANLQNHLKSLGLIKTGVDLACADGSSFSARCQIMQMAMPQEQWGMPFLTPSSTFYIKVLLLT